MRQVVAEARLLVVRVVRRRHLHAAGAELGVDEDGVAMIGMSRSVSGSVDLSCRSGACSVRRRDARHGRVAEHRLGPRRGDDRSDSPGSPAIGIADRPELP